MKDSDKIKKYIELLLFWNKTHNLISRNQTNNINDHIEDSLSVLEHLGDVLVDLGSGGGLPGIPIAIKAPQKKVILVESNSKKSSFLLNVTNKLNLTNVSVLHSRIEEVDPAQLPEGYEILVRAVGTTEHLIELTKAHLDGPGTQLKLMKTEEQAEEEPLPQNYAIKKINKLPSKGKDKGHILVTIEKNG